MRRDLDALKVEVGRLHAVRVRDVQRIEDAEFRVFSQFGEDGLIQWLVHRVPLGERTFVEFGVENYRESNTRFLVELDDWCGLAIAPTDAHARFMQDTEMAWRHSVVARTAFLTAENLDAVIGGAGFRGDIDLLSIDVDGVDYWLLNALTIVSPRILVVEYNSLFGPNACITVPYSASFDRKTAHFSTLYFGASLGALARLANAKGYALVGSNRAATNAFFVRRDVLGAIPEVEPAAAWRQTRVRQARSESGALTFSSEPAEQLQLIGHCPLVDVERELATTIARVFDL